MEILSSVVGSITDCLFGAAGRQLGYLLHYHDNIQTLENQTKKLAGIRDRVQGQIQAAERNLEIIETDVKKWMAEVDKITADAEKFLEDEIQANKRCLNEWCIDPRQRYRFSKAAKKKNLAISQLQEDGKFENVSHPAPPPGIISSSEVFSGTFKSRESLMKQIMEALSDDSVSVIGICGMGGVGKTKLVKEIGKQAKDDKLYEMVVMTVVSQTPSILKIQGEIADILGLKTLHESNELARASTLWERIKNEKQILVILDDVWERIELDKIGIPCRNNHSGCKVVFTSRSRHVCNEMDAKRIVAVETLSEQESWLLFSETAEIVNSDVNLIAREVAAECGGLPIAILTIARALRGKNKHVWRNAARQLKKSTPTDIPGMEAHVFSSLELSFNYLEPVEAKSLFLFCSLFPEDWKIPVEDLVLYGMGLRWFKDLDETIEEIRDRVHAIVSNITSSFLLIGGKEFVKMHDVVRDFALMVAAKYNQIFLVKAGLRLQEWPIRDTFEDLTCISLMENSIRELPDGLECPNLQVLLLQSNCRMVVPNNSFLGMKDLKLLDLSHTQLLQMPDSLSLLANLRTLNLRYCKLVDLSVIGNLSKLEILSLSNSFIKEIPTSFDQLSHLKLLDLNNCKKLTTIPYGVISGLGKLEELYMMHNSIQWGSEGVSRSTAKLAEFQALSRLTSLHICIPSFDLLSNDMPFQNLSNFTLIIGDDKYFLGHTSQCSRNMYFSFPGIPKPLDWFNKLLERTEKLIFYNFCDSEQILRGLTYHNLQQLDILENCCLVQIFHGDHQFISLHNLKQVKILYCSKLIKLFSPALLQSLICLEHIYIDRCYNLKEIFEKREVEDKQRGRKLDHIIISPSLRNLTNVIIQSCYELKNLFNSSIAKSLVKLRSLHLTWCSRLQEVVSNEEGENGASSDRIVFPSLYQIVLQDLSRLTCFSSALYTMEFPALEELMILGCPKMKTFGYGDQLTPKLNKVRLRKFGDQHRWNGNLNATVQQIFNEQRKKDKLLAVKELGISYKRL